MRVEIPLQSGIPNAPVPEFDRITWQSGSRRRYNTVQSHASSAVDIAEK